MTPCCVSPPADSPIHAPLCNPHYLPHLPGLLQEPTRLTKLGEPLHGALAIHSASNHLAGASIEPPHILGNIHHVMAASLQTHAQPLIDGSLIVFGSIVTHLVGSSSNWAYTPKATSIEPSPAFPTHIPIKVPCTSSFATSSQCMMQSAYACGCHSSELEDDEAAIQTFLANVLPADDDLISADDLIATQGYLVATNVGTYLLEEDEVFSDKAPALKANNTISTLLSIHDAPAAYLQAALKAMAHSTTTSLHPVCPVKENLSICLLRRCSDKFLSPSVLHDGTTFDDSLLFKTLTLMVNLDHHAMHTFAESMHPHCYSLLLAFQFMLFFNVTSTPLHLVAHLFTQNALQSTIFATEQALVTWLLTNHVANHNTARNAADDLSFISPVKNAPVISLSMLASTFHHVLATTHINLNMFLSTPFDPGGHVSHCDVQDSQLSLEQMVYYALALTHSNLFYPRAVPYSHRCHKCLPSIISSLKLMISSPLRGGMVGLQDQEITYASKMTTFFKARPLHRSELLIFFIEKSMVDPG